MQSPLLVLALGLALAVAGCTSPPPADGGNPTPTGGTTNPGNTTGNRTAGNATGNTTAPPAAPAAPQVVHEAPYQWTVTGPAEATFDVPRAASLTLNVTQQGPGVGSLTVELLDPNETSIGTASVTADPNGGGTGTATGRGPAGAYTLRFGGNGVGTLNVQVIAS